MKTTSNEKRSESMKQVWKEQREDLLEKRNANLEEAKLKQSQRIKKHYEEHPEHKEAISVAQKVKWIKYKKALKYCQEAGIDLGV